jgi:membrane protein YdbS with pleckstrin-like domain
MQKLNVKLGKDFRPAPQLRSLYYFYFFGAIIFGILTWMIPVAVFAPWYVTAILGAPVLLILLFTLYWIPKYYQTIIYRITGSEIVWRRGVWFKNTGIVPFNRITNVDIIQGPVSRHYGVGTLKIQTAGYAGANQRSSEIRLDGIEQFEEMREFLMKFVRGKKPVAVEAYEEEAAGTDAVKELVKIRKLLERRR